MSNFSPILLKPRNGKPLHYCIFFTYVISSNELLFLTFSEFLMDLNCSSQNVSILRRHVFQKSANIIAFAYFIISLRKRWPTSGGRSNVILIHFLINSQDPSKILKTFELNIHLMSDLYKKYRLAVTLFI